MRALLVIVPMLLSACRWKSPVEAHWLRVPADAAGDLSGIQRAQWLKEAKRGLPPRRELKATGRLVLPAFATLRGTRFHGAEVLLFPGANGGPQALAVITRLADSHSARLHLLTRQGSLYVDHSGIIPGGCQAAGWTANGAILSGLRASGALHVLWDGTRWRMQ